MTCFIEGYEDYYDSALLRESTPRAIKQHKCGECQDPILPGERYELTEGLWDGHFDRIKTCLACAEVRGKWMCSWEYGNIWDAILEEEINLGCLETLSVTGRDKVIEMFDRNWRE
jgi:hypothetical protein